MIERRVVLGCGEELGAPLTKVWQEVNGEPMAVERARVR